MIYKYLLLNLILLFIFPLPTLQKKTLLGGFSSIDVEDESFKKAMDFVLVTYQKVHNSNLMKIITISNAMKQVVSGMNYMADITFGYYNCAPGSNINDCSLLSKQECKVVVYVVAWMNSQEITSSECKPMISLTSSKRKRREAIAEGFIDHDYKDLIDYAITQLNGNSGGYYSLEAMQLHYVSKQLVSGTMYKMLVEIKVASCHKKLLKDCEDKLIVKSLEKINCSLSVWNQPWLKDAYSLTGHNCSSQLRTSDLKFNQGETFGDEDINQSELLTISNLQKMSIEDAFNLFKKKYERIYSNNKEEERRLEIFKSNMERVKFIQNHDLGSAIYGATEFADLSEDEFRRTHLTPKWDKDLFMKNMKKSKIPKISIPAEFDWRDHNAVTSVKDQGFCGSCWAFSVTGNVEGQYAIKKGTLLSFSEQELLDCDKLDEGCNGGLPSLAYEEIQRLGGLETEADYPYKGRDQKCTLNKSLEKVSVNGSVNISSNEADMQAWLVANGPMSIGINAFAMQFYFFGVSHPWHLACPADLDHGVLIVGYGIKKGWFRDIPYWIVKNSWGKSWGEKGYYLVYRGDGTCGLNQMVSSAIVF